MALAWVEGEWWAYGVLLLTIRVWIHRLAGGTGGSLQPPARLLIALVFARLFLDGHTSIPCIPGGLD